MKLTVSSQSPGLARTLSRTQSTDKDYLQQVISASRNYDEDSKEESKGPSNITVAVPTATPSAAAAQPDDGSIEALLAQQEAALGLQSEPTLEFQDESTIAAEINLLKQQSESVMELAVQKEMSL